MQRMFQSTPAIADGRTYPMRVTGVGTLLFQSTPAIADGRTFASGYLADENPVSIHARHR